MTFTGSENHGITLAEAAVLTKNYRDAQTTDDYIKGEYFSATAISDMLNQTDCVGVRVYYGIKKTGDIGKPCIVVCGVDTYGNDLIYGTLAENGMLCPPSCSVDNPLNSYDPPPAS